MSNYQPNSAPPYYYQTAYHGTYPNPLLSPAQPYTPYGPGPAPPYIPLEELPRLPEEHERFIRVDEPEKHSHIPVRRPTRYTPMKKRGSTKTKLLKAFLPIIFFGSVTAGVYFGCFYRKGDEHKPKHEESLSDTSEVPTPTRIGPAVTTVNSFVPTSSFASFGSVTNGNTGLVPNPTLKTAFSTFTNDAWTPLPTVTTVVINSPVAVRNPWDVSVFEKSE